MGNEVTAYHVSELIKDNSLIINDGFRAKNSQLNSTEGLPFARAGNINGGFNFVDADRVNPDEAHKAGIKVSKPGDVVFTSKGTVGRFAYVQSDTPQFIYSPQLCFWRATNYKFINPRFLYYWMHGPQFLAQIYALKRQTDMADYVSLRDQRAMKLSLPVLSTQKAIAHVLGSLDDRIELNRRMNETLEAMAQALFKSWFVDFDPVIDNALAGGKEIPAELSEKARTRGALGDKRKPLPKEIRTLFPDEFTYSDELGWISEGWGSGVVGDFGDVVCGKTPPTKDQSNYGDDVPFITIPDMHGVTYVTSTARKLSIKGADTQRKKNLPENTVCVSCIATPGLVVLTSEVSQTNQQINSVVPQNPKAAFFIYEGLSLLGEQIRAAGSGGSVFSNLSKGRFEKLPVLMPAQAVQEAFQQVVEPIFIKLLACRKNNGELSNLRDTLLPKLLSGELRIPEAEKMVEELAL